MASRLSELRPGRPPSGFAHYLRDMVYGALDGVITTLAVMAGANGADLGARVALILGLANLLGDGISMGGGNYLGLKSELEQAGDDVDGEAPWRHGLATLAAFVAAGAIPLAAYLLPRPAGVSVFGAALALAAVALAATGAGRAPFVGRSPWRSALEMLVVGAVAAAAAYGAGAAAAALIRG